LSAQTNAKQWLGRLEDQFRHVRLSVCLFATLLCP
jgi:hypothetical protein